MVEWHQVLRDLGMNATFRQPSAESMPKGVEVGFPPGVVAIGNWRDWFFAPRFLFDGDRRSIARLEQVAPQHFRPAIVHGHGERRNGRQSQMVGEIAMESLGQFGPQGKHRPAPGFFIGGLKRHSGRNANQVKRRPPSPARGR